MDDGDKVRVGAWLLLAAVLALSIIFAVQASYLRDQVNHVCTNATTVNDVPIYYAGEWHDFIPRCRGGE